MLAVNAVYFQNQPSLAEELYKAISNHFSHYLKKRNFEIELKKFESKAFDVISKAHEYNAKMEQVRDFVDLYYINDIHEDEKILTPFVDVIDEVLPDIEFILDSEEIASFPNPIRDIYLNAFDELYSTIVNAKFAISHKIAQAYADSKSDIKLLQDA